MTYKEKIFSNLTSIKLWTLGIATVVLIMGYISEVTWGGLAFGLMGLTRAVEYFTVFKNNGG